MERGIPDVLETLCSSDCRMGIVEELLEKPVGTSELERALDYDGSTVRRNVKTLEDEGWILREGGVNRVVDDRRFLLEMAADTAATFYAYGKNQEFWDRHRLSGIPEEFRKRLRQLRAAEVMESPPTEVFQPRRRLRGQIRESRWIRGIVPIFRPGCQDLLVDLADRMEHIGLIVAADVYDRLLEGGGEPLRAAMGKDGVEVVRSDQTPSLSLIVTDALFSLGLFNEDGTYDPNRDLVCHSEPAIEWGLDLYRHFRGRT